MNILEVAINWLEKADEYACDNQEYQEGYQALTGAGVPESSIKSKEQFLIEKGLERHLKNLNR